nr:MAG: RNA dependent RNA polymerase [Leviviridae sp.]
MLEISEAQFSGRRRLRRNQPLTSDLIRKARRHGKAFVGSCSVPLEAFLRFIPESSREVALSKFTASVSDRETADRAAIAKYIAWEDKLPDSVSNEILPIARGILRLILKDFRKHDYLYLGHGASVELITRTDGQDHYTSRTCFSGARKMEHLRWIENDVTLFSQLYRSSEIISANLVVDPLARMSILTTVPKKREISRCINIEGVLSKAMQHVIGCNLREQFRLFGLRYGFATDLNESDRDNAYSAYLGSRYGHLATIDFSSASDSISNALVEALFRDNGPLCTKYLMLMESVRSTHVLVDGAPLATKKFASMGNAFIFELESIIFFTLTLAFELARDYPLVLSFGERHMLRRVKQILKTDQRLHVISVFGDDTLLRSTSYDASYVSTMAAFGLTVNPEKSFGSTSDFRESCGYDFRDGQFVREFYLKDLNITSFIRMLNFYQLNDRLVLSDEDLEFIAKFVPRILWCSTARLKGADRLFFKDAPSGYLLVNKHGYNPKVKLELGPFGKIPKPYSCPATLTLLMWATTDSSTLQRPLIGCWLRRIEEQDEFIFHLAPDPVEQEISAFIRKLIK